MFLHWLLSFLPSQRPLMTRPAYRREMVAAISFPVAMAMIEGGVIGVLAKKAFDVGPAGFAAIMAAPMLANITSFIWAMLGRGRPKVRLIVRLQIMTLAVIAAIALLPDEDAYPRLAPMALVILVITARGLLAGIVALRSTVWRMNYPRNVRASIAARLTLIQTLTFSIAPLVGYAFLDWNVQAFRVIYPLSAAVGLIGVISFSRIRVRGERAQLAYEKQPDAQPTAHGEVSPVYEFDRKRSPQFWQVLKRDKGFRLYMVFQFLAGCGVMSSQTVAVYLIAGMTEGVQHEYALTVLLTAVLPMFLATITTTIWARYLDRVHIVTFRTRQSYLWLAAIGMIWVGLAQQSLMMVAAARVLTGVWMGGGALAWQLGHNDFADRRLVAVYMGIHQMLTGVRGITMPFIAMALLTGWPAFDLLPWMDSQLTVPGFSGMGTGVFGISMTFAFVAAAGFHWMNWKMKPQITRD